MSGFLSFNGTSAPNVNSLLATLERAGNWYHNTSHWPDDSWEQGKSCLDLIQDSAEVAAGEIADLEQQLATARAEAEALRAARDEACDGWERCRESYYRGNTDSLGYAFAVRRIADLRAVGAKP